MQAGGREEEECNKAECISPGMKLQRLEGAEARGKAGEVLQILV